MAWGQNFTTRKDLSHTLMTCGLGKFGFHTRQQAVDAAEMAMHRDEARPGYHIEAYKCTEHGCGHWHIGQRKITFPRD